MLVSGHPLELLAVVALFAIPGAWIAIQVLTNLSSVFELFSFSASFGLLFLLVALIVLAVGVGLVAVAYLIYRRDDVGRGLAYVVTGVVAVSALVSDTRTTASIVAMIATLCASAVLAFAPAVREAFAAARNPERPRPTSVVVAEVCLLLFAAFMGLLALIDFLAGSDSAKYVVVGLLLAGVAVFALSTYRRISTGDRQARLLASIAAAAGLVLVLMSAGAGGATLLIALAAAVPAFLWLPSDARRFFGDAPLNIEVARPQA